MTTISIHAPRTGSDTAQHPDSPRGGHFNPRSPHGERHPQWATETDSLPTFQSTLPARGATGVVGEASGWVDISIHAPRTGSDIKTTTWSLLAYHFNPRSPHGERPVSGCQRGTAPDYFNPRSPHGERRARARRSKRPHTISIHAPRTGSDDYLCGLSDNPQDFNPRSPHGERHGTVRLFAMWTLFQSTLPARGATNADSLHPGDVEFQSTLPARGATKVGWVRRLWLQISIHAPRTGSDGRSDGKGITTFKISIHAPRTGSDVLWLVDLIIDSTISIHAPRTGSDYRRRKL